MPLLGTMQNPLQVQQAPGQAYAQQMEGERQRRLAEALAQQELVTSRSTGRNILGAVLQHFATQATAKRGEKNAAEGFALQQKLELEQQQRAAEHEQGLKSWDARRIRTERSKAADEYGLQGAAKLQFIETGKVMEQKGPQSVWAPSGGMLVNKVTGESRPIPGYAEQAAQIAAAGRGPTAPRDLTFEEYQALPPEQRAAFDAFKGRGGAQQKAPAGYRFGPDGALEAIPGGPAANPKVTAEAGAKLAQLENALTALQQYKKGVVGEGGEFNDFAARSPENQRAFDSAVTGKLRAESGATITPEEKANEMGRYGPGWLSSDKTNIAAVDRMESDLKNQIAALSGGGGAPLNAPAASAGGVQEGATAVNPKTGERLVLRGGQWVPAGG